MYVVCIKYLSMSGYRIWVSVGRPTFPVSGTESVWLVPGTASVTMPTVTVPQLFRELQVEPKPEDTWAVGNRVRDLYVKKYGQQPEKDLRPKTNGRGSHCFALYDEAEWRSIIEQIIRDRGMEKWAQGSLF